VRIVGSHRAEASRVPTISFAVEDEDPAAVVRQIDRLGMGIRFGDFHSRRLLDQLDLSRRNGVVRMRLCTTTRWRRWIG